MLPNTQGGIGMNISTTPGTVGRVRTPKAAIFRRLAVICAMAVSVFAVSVSAASAGSDESITTKHGSAAFIDRGETLIANDKSKDRFSVMASLTWKEGKKGRSATVRDGNGPGNTPNSRNLGIREGTRVHLKLCYVNNGVVFKCSRAQAATA
jgi:hypothetical protein